MLAIRRNAGVPELCRELGVRWLNLSKGAFQPRELMDALVFHQVELPTILADAPLVNIPVMKTHAKTGMSGADARLYGGDPL